MGSNKKVVGFSGKEKIKKKRAFGLRTRVVV